jgi:hypothetical protein
MGFYSSLFKAHVNACSFEVSFVPFAIHYYTWGQDAGQSLQEFSARKEGFRDSAFPHHISPCFS